MIDYSTVTEIAGDKISQEQLERLCHRYFWAGIYCVGKDVVEAACGSGPGLGHLVKVAKSLRAGDYTPSTLKWAEDHYGSRVPLQVFDAQEMPYPDRSADVVILFEALYYLASTDKFVQECKRILRPGGVVLIANANKDLYDFNPSPHSYTYHGVVELEQLFSSHGFSVECFGFLPVTEVSLRQKVLRPVKKAAVSLGLVPKTTGGKKWLKRVVFGKMVRMPEEIQEGMVSYKAPTSLPLNWPDRTHKVIYCAANRLD
jgi:SAM-dependent methyltransferase